MSLVYSIDIWVHPWFLRHAAVLGSLDADLWAAEFSARGVRHVNTLPSKATLTWQPRPFGSYEHMRSISEAT